MNAFHVYGDLITSNTVNEKYFDLHHGFLVNQFSLYTYIERALHTGSQSENNIIQAAPKNPFRQDLVLETQTYVHFSEQTRREVLPW